MFAELSITSNFTFLTGASHPEEFMQRAALFGLPAIAIADANSVAGIVRAHTPRRLILGSERAMAWLNRSFVAVFALLAGRLALDRA